MKNTSKGFLSRLKTKKVSRLPIQWTCVYLCTSPELEGLCIWCKSQRVWCGLGQKRRLCKRKKTEKANMFGNASDHAAAFGAQQWIQSDPLYMQKYWVLNWLVIMSLVYFHFLIHFLQQQPWQFSAARQTTLLESKANNKDKCMIDDLWLKKIFIRHFNQHKFSTKGKSSGCISFCLINFKAEIKKKETNCWTATSHNAITVFLFRMHQILDQCPLDFWLWITNL